MCVCATAKRRRRQHRQKFNHLPPRARPYYKVRDEHTSKRRLQRQLETERRIKQGKK